MTSKGRWKSGVQYLEQTAAHYTKVTLDPMQDFVHKNKVH
jgi:hypothetical protein